MTFVVTRQKNFYDSGAPSVEIAYGMDNVSPGAMSNYFAEDFNEEDDPREIAELAIRLRKRWMKYLGHRWFWDWATGVGEDHPLPFTISGASSMGLYPTVHDGLTAAGLRRWAKETYEKMPKCEHCGTPTEDEYQDEFGDKVPCCSDFCAEKLFDRTEL
jgi:hypothetical protein